MVLGKSVRLYMFCSAYSLAETKRNEMRGSQPSLDCLPTSIAERKMVISTILSPTCNTYTSAELSSGLLSWLATRVMERMVEWGLGEGTALPEDG